MKNNTKLIMETWRRFLSEGDMDDPGQMHDPADPPSGLPASDEHLEDDNVQADIEDDLALMRNSDPEHEAYNPHGMGELEPLSDDMYGGPNHEDRVQAVYNRLMRDPTDPLHGFTEQEKEEGRVRYEEEMPEDSSSMEDYDSQDYYDHFPTGHDDF